MPCSPTRTLLFLMTRPPRRSTLFPYTTLFRSFMADGSWIHRFRFSGVMSNTAPANVSRPIRWVRFGPTRADRSEEHTSELQSLRHLVCRLLLEKKQNTAASVHAEPQRLTTPTR